MGGHSSYKFLKNNGKLSHNDYSGWVIGRMAGLSPQINYGNSSPCTCNLHLPPFMVEKCFFFNREHFDGGPGCKFDAKSCKFRHEYMSKNEWDQCKEKPPSRPSSPAPRPGRKGRSGGGGNPSFIDPSRCCEEFLRFGRCDLLEKDQGCPKLHIKQSELDRENKQRNAAQTKTRINAE